MSDNEDELRPEDVEVPSPGTESPTSQAPRSKSRLPLIVTLAGIALVGLLAAGGYYWYQHVHSPEYALAQIAKAAAGGDWGKVTAYFDAEAFAGDAADAAIAEALRGASATDTSTIQFKKELTASARPVLVTAFVKAMEGSIGTEPDYQLPLATSAARLARTPLSIDQDGDDVNVRLGNETTKPEAVVVARMRNIDGTWKVVGWTNADQSLKTAGGPWWAGYKASPEFSLTRLAVASGSGDWDEFQKYFDTDAVSSGLVDAAVAQAAADLVKTEKDNPFAGLGLAMLQGMKPALVQQFKDEFKKAVVEKGQSGKEPVGSNVFLNANPASVSASGDKATVKFEEPDDKGKSQQIVVELKKMDGYWRVVAFQNAAELMKDVK